jgi:hypothetical protein
VDFYLIELPNKKAVLYSEGEDLHPHPANDMDKGSPVDRLIMGLDEKGTRFSLILKRIIISVVHAYHAMENRIDPQEQVLKRLNYARHSVFFHATQWTQDQAVQILKKLFTVCRKKHLIWVAIDGFITMITILLTPVLMPLPGPNVFFYYPLLRTISHYRACRAAHRTINLSGMKLLPLKVLDSIEEVLRQPSPYRDEEQLEILARNLKLEGLPTFLRRWS